MLAWSPGAKPSVGAGVMKGHTAVNVHCMRIWGSYWGGIRKTFSPVNPSKSTYQDFETCDSYGVGVFNVAQVLVQLASTLAAADAGESDFYRRVLAAVTAPKTEGPKLGMSEESTEEPVVGCGACDDPIHLGPAGLNWGSCPVFWDLVGMLRIELHVKKQKKLDDLIIRHISSSIMFHNQNILWSKWLKWLGGLLAPVSPIFLS